MDINLFLQNNTGPVISTDSDADKFQKIVTMLCDKRKHLEEVLLTDEKKDDTETATALLEPVEEMRVFGISEIDYQKYLTVLKNSDPKLF